MRSTGRVCGTCNLINIGADMDTFHKSQLVYDIKNYPSGLLKDKESLFRDAFDAWKTDSLTFSFQPGAENPDITIRYDEGFIRPDTE